MLRLLKDKRAVEGSFNQFLEMKRGAAMHTLESLMLLPVSANESHTHSTSTHTLQAHTHTLQAHTHTLQAHTLYKHTHTHTHGCYYVPDWYLLSLSNC